MDPVDRDAQLDAALEALPKPRAPHTLVPRVLAATIEREPRASATGWSTWPPGWRIASVAAVVVLVVLASRVLSAPPPAVSGAAERAGEAATVVRVLWEVMLQPVATYLFILGISLALGCALAWAALEAALGGASQR